MSVVVFLFVCFFVLCLFCVWLYFCTQSLVSIGALLNSSGTGKTTAIRRAAVRGKLASLGRFPIENTPLRPHEHHNTMASWGLRAGPHLRPHYSEIYLFSSWELIGLPKTNHRNSHAGKSRFFLRFIYFSFDFPKENTFFSLFWTRETFFFLSLVG